MRLSMALFGEAEKGQFKTPYTLKTMSQLVDTLGNPPPESQGLFFAIQGLLFQRELIYFRVSEEGFSEHDYYPGLKILENMEHLHALCLPGLGESELLHTSRHLCQMHDAILITTQEDLYDYLTSI
jgi:hypothetical protein